MLFENKHWLFVSFFQNNSRELIFNGTKYVSISAAIAAVWWKLLLNLGILSVYSSEVQVWRRRDCTSIQ